MITTCFVCGAVARFYDPVTGERLCGNHRLGSPYRGEYVARVCSPAVRHERIMVEFHGWERAALILAGDDPASNADLVSWRRAIRKVDDHDIDAEASAFR